MKFATIYLLDWPNSNIKYIGRTLNLNSRLATHLNTLKRGTHYNIELQNQYNQSGPPKVVVLETCTEEVQIEREKYWITKYLINKEVHLVNVQNKVIPKTIETNNEQTFKELLDTTKSAKYIFVSPNNEIIYANTLLDIIKGDTSILITSSTSVSLGQVNKGILKQYRGYRKYLGENTYILPTAKNYILYNKDNKEIKFSCIAQFCRETPEFSDNWYAEAGCLSKVLNSAAKSYKGYTLNKKPSTT